MWVDQRMMVRKRPLHILITVLLLARNALTQSDKPNGNDNGVRREYQSTLCVNRFSRGRQHGVNEFVAFLKSFENNLHVDGRITILPIDSKPEVILREQVLYDTKDEELKEAGVKIRFRRTISHNTQDPADAKPSELTAKRYFLDTTVAKRWKWQLGDDTYRFKSKCEQDVFHFASIITASTSVLNFDIQKQPLQTLRDVAKVFTNLGEALPHIHPGKELIVWLDGFKWEMKHKFIIKDLQSNKKMSVNAVLALVYGNEENLLDDSAAPLKAEWEFKLEEEEGTVPWIAEGAWALFHMLNMDHSWAVPAYEKNNFDDDEYGDATQEKKNWCVESSEDGLVLRNMWVDETVFVKNNATDTTDKKRKKEKKGKKGKKADKEKKKEDVNDGDDDEDNIDDD